MCTTQHNITGLAATGDFAGTSVTPVLLNELIYMFLPGGPSDDLYTNQTKTQTGLVLIAIISIPFMFLPKPLILKYYNWKETKGKGPSASGVVLEADHDLVDESSEEILENSHVDETSKGKEKEKPAVIPSGGHGHDDEEEFQFGELMIHQLLETIEFVLGSVSHTASYLRLWALSLAHSELATVFWEKIMFEVITLTQDMNFIIIGLITFCGFAVWFMVTLLVMMFMELLSALLHALRLHWVEFQSKFYKGDGYAFTPFSLRKVYNHNRIRDVLHAASGPVSK